MSVRACAKRLAIRAAAQFHAGPPAVVVRRHASGRVSFQVQSEHEADVEAYVQAMGSPEDGVVGLRVMRGERAMDLLAALAKFGV